MVNVKPLLNAAMDIQAVSLLNDSASGFNKKRKKRLVGKALNIIAGSAILNAEGGIINAM